MIGDLAIAPGKAAVDLAPSTPDSPGRAGAPKGRSLPSGFQEHKLAAGAAGGASTARLEADRLKALLTDARMRVTTHLDEASGHLVMLVEDRTTGEVVDQIPSEKLLRLFAALREPLVDERA